MTALPYRTLLAAAALCVAACATVPPAAAAKPAAKSASKTADKPSAEPAYGRREDVLAFAREVAARRGLDAAWIEERLAQARFQPNVAKFIMPPPAGTAKNWYAYRSRFVDPIRIDGGVAFWRANEAWLAKARALYGVPPEIVVAIVGVETIYGRHTGNFRVADALATLAFDFPAGRKDRSAFFRDELEQLFVLAHSEGLDPLALRGSYAGAMGWPQFMPSSWNRYAVDFDGDGHVDLHGNTADVIGSVAHFLSEHGWVEGLPTHFEVAPPVDTTDRAVLLAPDILPSFTAAEFAARGARLAPAAEVVPGKLALVELQNGDAAPSYVAGTQNFYTITRYNWSSYYALAVIELGAEIARAYGGR